MSDFKKKSNKFYALLMLLQPLVEIVSKSTLVKYSAGLKSWHLGRLLMNVTDRGGVVVMVTWELSFFTLTN